MPICGSILTELSNKVLPESTGLDKNPPFLNPLKSHGTPPLLGVASIWPHYIGTCPQCRQQLSKPFPKNMEFWASIYFTMDF